MLNLYQKVRSGISNLHVYPNVWLKFLIYMKGLVEIPNLYERFD